ncbi:MAG: hypothetical protein ABJD24_05780 [Acidimicrobiales bacterium]
MSPRLVGERLTSRWVRLYSTGVTTDARAERIDEVASDVWEHQHDHAVRGIGKHVTSLQITSRLVCGIPADLSWRHSQVHTNPNSATGDSMFAQRLWSFTRLLIIFQGATLIILGGAMAIYQLIVMGVVTLGGLAIRHRYSAVGIAMICVASLFAASLFWFSFVLLTGMATLILTVITAPWDRLMSKGWSSEDFLERHRAAAVSESSS